MLSRAVARRSRLPLSLINDRRERHFEWMHDRPIDRLLERVACDDDRADATDFTRLIFVGNFAGAARLLETRQHAPSLYFLPLFLTGRRRNSIGIQRFRNAIWRCNAGRPQLYDDRDKLGRPRVGLFLTGFGRSCAAFRAAINIEIDAAFHDDGDGSHRKADRSKTVARCVNSVAPTNGIMLFNLLRRLVARGRSQSRLLAGASLSK